MNMPTEKQEISSLIKATDDQALLAWQDTNFRAQCREASGVMPETWIRVVSESTPDPASVVIYPANESK